MRGLKDLVGYRMIALDDKGFTVKKPQQKRNACQATDSINESSDFSVRAFGFQEAGNHRSYRG